MLPQCQHSCLLSASLFVPRSPACLACSASGLNFEAKGSERGWWGLSVSIGCPGSPSEGVFGGPGIGPGSPQLRWLDPKANASCSGKDLKGQGRLQPQLKLSSV